MTAKSLAERFAGDRQNFRRSMNRSNQAARDDESPPTLPGENWLASQNQTAGGRPALSDLSSADAVLARTRWQSLPALSPALRASSGACWRHSREVQSKGALAS